VKKCLTTIENVSAVRRIRQRLRAVMEKPATAILWRSGEDVRSGRLMKKLTEEEVVSRESLGWK